MNCLYCQQKATSTGKEYAGIYPIQENFRCNTCMATFDVDYQYSNGGAPFSYGFRFQYQNDFWFVEVSDQYDSVFIGPYGERPAIVLPRSEADKIHPKTIVEKLPVYLLFS